MARVQCLRVEDRSPAADSRTLWNGNTGSQRDLRHAFGRFATGVTVISIDSPQGPFGMTVNSFASVSLDPALILWSVAKDSARCENFCQASHFAVNILGEEQAALARAFARDPYAFDDLVWHGGRQGVPVLAGCVATLECCRQAIHDGGDHRIIVGEVEQASVAEGRPLLFAGGEFRALA